MHFLSTRFVDSASQRCFETKLNMLFKKMDVGYVDTIDYWTRKVHLTCKQEGTLILWIDPEYK